MCLSYIGGKSRISSFIKPYIPKNIETYVEPFSGMYWVFFKMELPTYPNLKRVVYNDVNPLNVNLFLALKDYNKFYEVSKDLPIENDELFNRFKSEIFDENLKLNSSEANFDIAYKYAYVLSQVWSGTDPKRGTLIKNGGYVSKKDGVYKSKFEIFRSKLPDPKWQKYFDSISNIEMLDFEDVIKKYDSPSTYFYCDPPYFKTENYYANHDFGKETHERLANSLKSIQGRFGLSYYHFDDLEVWFPTSEYKWYNKDFVKNGGALAGKSQSKGTELLILNY